jgi:hypothetical protein
LIDSLICSNRDSFYKLTNLLPSMKGKFGEYVSKR